MENTKILFQLPVAIRDRFRKACHAEERTMSQQLRLLIDEFVESQRK